jgi:transcriptional regulator with XRE-family HTH domain
LRQLRADSGATLDEVAAAVGISKSALSRIESGETGVRIPVLRQLFVKYDVFGPDAKMLEELAQQGARRGWWNSAYGGKPPEAFRELIGLEEEAKFIYDFSNPVLSGLLQTKAYSEAILRAQSFSDLEVVESVKIRQRRQERLPDLTLWSVIPEEVLLRPIGSRKLMAEQILHLAELSNRENIEIRVLGLAAGAHAGIGGGFCILGFESAMDSEAVYVEAPLIDAMLESSKEIEAFRIIFEDVHRQALTPSGSMDLLLRLEEEYRNDPN